MFHGSMRSGFAAILTLALSALIAPTALYAQTQPGSPQTQPKNSDWIKVSTAFSKMEKDLAFTVKIIDQNGDPVDGAKATIKIWHTIAKYPGFTYVEIAKTTDKTGSFSVNGERGYEFFIKEIQRAGYEYLVTENPRSSFSVSRTDDPFPKKGEIVQYRLRKRAEGVLLIHDFHLRMQVHASDLQRTSSGLTRVVGYDSIRRFLIGDLNKTIIGGEQANSDVLLGGTLDDSGTTWTVVLGPGDPSGGIQASTQYLYEAPADGYARSMVFNFSGPKVPKAKYLYLKSRNPPIYSRIVIASINANKVLVSINGSCATNPYGDRNLEDNPDIPGADRIRLQKEVDKAFRLRQRPAKPDLAALIQADKSGPKPASAR